jgi:glutamyl-tRNA(Gln) amidotransferase subunit D
MTNQKIPLYSKVEIISKDKKYVGILLPEEKDSQVIKLDSGYNISFDKKNVQKITLLEKPKEKTIDEKKKKTDFNKDSIVIIHTGGTISSKVDYSTGAVIASFDPDSLIGMFPELNEIQNIESEFIGNIMSDNFRFKHFNLMASAIHKRVLLGQRKFIVTCGTDFLHYASAGLSFLLKDLPLKVLVVGSQRSSDRASSDAGFNLINAAYFLENSTFEGVGVCMHSKSSDETCDILHGINVRKMHSSRRDAFKPINCDKIATVDYSKKSIVMNKELSYFVDKEIPKKIHLLKEDLKIGLIYSHPQFNVCELDSYENFDGLVLAGSGFGHFPILDDESSSEHKKIYERLKILAKKIPIVMSTQTIHGEVNLNVYTPLRMLKEIGIMGHLSTAITETTYMKLAYLISTCDKKDIPLLMETNILGELDFEKFFDFQDE